MTKKIYFENDSGRVEMFLGGTGPIRVTALSGFGNPEKSYDSVKFAGKDGQKTLNDVVCPRTLIISGDIKADSREFLEEIFKVFGNSGTLYLDYGEKKRKIPCSQVTFSDGTRKGKFMNFVLTLVSDEAYFTDFYQTDLPIYSREGRICGSVKFPCILSVKTTQKTAENFGEEKVEPAIKIYNFHDENSEITGNIVIENQTTGQKIELMTGTEENEEIIIDIKHRKITSTLRGNILHLISDDTFLNKFWLNPGENILKAEHNNVGEEISVVCSYYSNYREGIY